MFRCRKASSMSLDTCSCESSAAVGIGSAVARRRGTFSGTLIFTSFSVTCKLTRKVRFCKHWPKPSCRSRLHGRCAGHLLTFRRGRRRRAGSIQSANRCTSSGGATYFGASQPRRRLLPVPDQSGRDGCSMSASTAGAGPGPPELGRLERAWIVGTCGSTKRTSSRRGCGQMPTGARMLSESSLKSRPVSTRSARLRP